MCELLILKLNVFLNASDFSLIVWRWIHSLFNEKESSLEPQNSKNQNTFPSWFLVRKTSWRIPAGFSKFSTEIFDRDFRPYRIQPKPTGIERLQNSEGFNYIALVPPYVRSIFEAHTKLSYIFHPSYIDILTSLK